MHIEHLTDQQIYLLGTFCLIFYPENIEEKRKRKKGILAMYYRGKNWKRTRCLFINPDYDVSAV